MKKELNINKEMLEKLKEKCNNAGYNYTINDDSIILFKNNRVISISELIELDLEKPKVEFDQCEALMPIKKENHFTKEESEMLELASEIFDEYLNTDKTPIKQTIEENEFIRNIDNFLDPVVEESYIDEFYNYGDPNMVIRELVLNILKNLSLINTSKDSRMDREDYKIPKSQLRTLVSVILYELGINVGDFIDEVYRYHNNDGKYYNREYTPKLFVEYMDSVLLDILQNNKPGYFKSLKEKIKNLCLILVNAVTFCEPADMNYRILEDYANICIYKNPWSQYDRENITSYVLDGEYVDELFDLSIEDQIQFLTLVTNNELDSSAFEGISDECECIIDDYRAYLTPTLGITLDIDNLDVDLGKDQVIYKNGNMKILVLDQLYKHYLLEFDDEFGTSISVHQFLRNELQSIEYLESINGITI